MLKYNFRVGRLRALWLVFIRFEYWYTRCECDGYIYDSGDTDTPKQAIKSVLEKIQQSENVSLDKRQRGRFFRRHLRDINNEIESARNKHKLYMLESDNKLIRNKE